MENYYGAAGLGGTEFLGHGGSVMAFFTGLNKKHVYTRPRAVYRARDRDVGDSVRARTRE